MTRPVALIAGATGLIGRRIAQHLGERGGWNVIGVARRPAAEADMRWIALDLADAGDCRAKLGGTPVSHLFYAARYDHPEGASELVDANAAMLRNLVDVLESNGALAHVHAVHGSKYYGHQLGPVAVPMREDQPRAPGKNFYFEQQEFLQARAGDWTYTITRPHTFCDSSTDTPRSIGLLIAVYAAVQSELGLPLDFPGSAQGYAVRTQFTDIGLLARAIVWMAGEPRCANQAFNVVNGDCPRWSALWPEFARNLGISPGPPRDFDIAAYMADKSAVWQRVVRKHALRATAFDQLVLWPYGNYVFKPEWDIMSSMAKARACGFLEEVGTATMFARQFERYRAAKIIP